MNTTTCMLIAIAYAWWMAGFAVAQGFWSSLFALFPPWGMYLFIERLLELGDVL